MRYLGIDYGERRIGLAYGDEVGVAVPLQAAVEATSEARMEHVLRTAKDRRVTDLVVGYPYNMDGTTGFKAKEVDAFIAQLEARLGLPVHRVDERLTSHQAETDMRALGGGGRKKHSVRAQQEKRRSGELDSRAAALILQDFLNQKLPPTLEPDPDAPY